MKRIIPLITFLLITCFIVSCYYDNEEYLYPVVDTDSSCDTTNVTLTAGVMPILDSRCLSCHGNSTAGSLGGGINLETYSQLMIWVNNGQLEGSINHMSGFAQMPQGSSKLDDCSLNKITAWINQGALNN